MQRSERSTVVLSCALPPGARPRHRATPRPHRGTGVLPVDIQRGSVRVLIPLRTFVVKPRSESSGVTPPAADGGVGVLRGDNEEPGHRAMASSEAQIPPPLPPSNVLPLVKPNPRPIPRGNREALTSHQRSLPLLHCPVGRKGTVPARSARRPIPWGQETPEGELGRAVSFVRSLHCSPGHPAYALRSVGAIHSCLLPCHLGLRLTGAQLVGTG
jgi:hypothetical protein